MGIPTDIAKTVFYLSSISNCKGISYVRDQKHEGPTCLLASFEGIYSAWARPIQNWIPDPLLWETLVSAFLGENPLDHFVFHANRESCEEINCDIVKKWRKTKLKLKQTNHFFLIFGPTLFTFSTQLYYSSFPTLYPSLQLLLSPCSIIVRLRQRIVY